MKTGGCKNLCPVNTPLHSSWIPPTQLGHQHNYLQPFWLFFFSSAFHETLAHLTGATIIVRQIAQRYFGKVNLVAYRRSVNKLQISAEGAFHCTQNLSDASPCVPSALLLLQQITQHLSDSRAAITRPADDWNAKPAEGCAWENGVYHRSKP